MFGKGHVLENLTAAELDAVIQNLARWGFHLWDYGTFGKSYTEFQISVSRWKNLDNEWYAAYNIYFPRKTWKRIRVNLSDHFSEDLMMTGRVDSDSEPTEEGN